MLKNEILIHRAKRDGGNHSANFNLINVGKEDSCGTYRASYHQVHIQTNTQHSQRCLHTFVVSFVTRPCRAAFFIYYPFSELYKRNANKKCQSEKWKRSFQQNQRMILRILMLNCCLVLTCQTVSFVRVLENDLEIFKSDFPGALFRGICYG